MKNTLYITGFYKKNINWSQVVIYNHIMKNTLYITDFYKKI